jgi:DnaJ family protein C protein 7
LNELIHYIKDCKQAIDIKPDYLKAYLRRAKCYSETEQHEDALRDYEAALKLDPDNEGFVD